MNKTLNALALLAALLTGCATVTPPPDRIHWDESPASTQCTDQRSTVVPQGVFSLLLAGAGGMEIGTAVALGQAPILGVGIAALGLGIAHDTDKKTQQIRECQQFQEYIVLRESRSRQAGDESPEARLRRVDLLLESGAITEEEHTDARQRVLQDM